MIAAGQARGGAIQDIDRAGIPYGADILIRHADGEVGDPVAVEIAVT